MIRRLFIFAIFSWAVPAAAQTSLEKAYLKELAFLKAEKEALQKRQAEVAKSQADRLAAARAELQTLEAQLLGLKQQAETAENQLREAENTSDRVETLEQATEILRQASEIFTHGGHELAAPPQDPTPAQVISALNQTFLVAAKVIQSGSKIHKSSGSFFLPDGTLTEGELLHLGGIAAYGASPSGSGALMPAGGGRFKLWPEPADATATALFAGDRPASLKIFLFEAADKAVVVQGAKTIQGELKKGGPIGYTIVALAIVALLMALIRGISLLWASWGLEHFIDRVVLEVQQRRHGAALDLAKSHNSAAGRVLTAAVKNLSLERARVEDLVQESLLNESPAIERFGTTINVIAGVAPLLGLLGTVTGMIATFDVITQFGTGDPRLLSAGISEALVTTELGLMTAIPCLLLGTLLNGRAEAILGQLEHGALRVLNAAQGLEPQTQDLPARGLALESAP